MCILHSLPSIQQDVRAPCCLGLVVPPLHSGAGHRSSYLPDGARGGRNTRRENQGSRLGKLCHHHHGSLLGVMLYLHTMFILPVNNSMSGWTVKGFDVLSGTLECVKQASFPNFNVSFSNIPTQKSLVFGCSWLTIYSI